MNRTISRWLERALWSVAVAGVAYAQYMVFMVVPNEAIMGAVQRIFYFHVASAVAAYGACLVVLLAGIAYLWKRSPFMDAAGAAASEVALLFATIVLLTGSIWGHAAWGTWFRWEPRLMSFVIFWLIFLGIVLLRVFEHGPMVGAHSAILGILGALTVPVVVYSVQLLPAAEQLHPVVSGSAWLAPEFKVTLRLAIFSFLLLSFLLIWIRARIEYYTRFVLLEARHANHA